MSAQRAGRQWRLTRADKVAVTVGLVALVAGVVLFFAASGPVLENIGIGLIGLAAVAFVSLIFLLVGESEDREYHKGA